MEEEYPFSVERKMGSSTARRRNQVVAKESAPGPMMSVTGWEEQFFSADLSCSFMCVTELECTIADSEMNPPSFYRKIIYSEGMNWWKK
jgi:hypothetical protein